MKTILRVLIVACAIGSLDAIVVACHVTPLPVPHPEYWSPEYGATDYPSVGNATAKGAGRDGGP